MIHEGAHGIQAADLLGRKVVMEEGRGLTLLASRVSATCTRAQAIPQLEEFARSLALAMQKAVSVTQMAWSSGNPVEALANAVPYMQGFGHTVLAWIWLDVAITALLQDQGAKQSNHATLGALGAMQYFFRYELPKVNAWYNVVQTRDMTCADLALEAF